MGEPNCEICGNELTPIFALKNPEDFSLVGLRRLQKSI
jgi:hypothetical protein